MRTALGLLLAAGSASAACTLAENQTGCECAAKETEPAVPAHALKFCHIFPDQSCCLPAQDNEIEEHYFNLLDAGDICAKESSMAKDALKQVFCAACSPKQPQYTYTDAAGTVKFKICKSLVEKIDPTKFDDCGMVRVAERGAPCKGDDVIVPSSFWSNCADGDAVQVRGGDGCDLSAINATDSVATATADQCGLTQFIAEKSGGCGGEGAYDTCAMNWGGMPCTKARESLGETACSGETCKNYYKLLNDPSGAKPPFLDDYEMEIIDCDSKVKDCSAECYTGDASALQLATRMVIAVVFAVTANLY